MEDVAKAMARTSVLSYDEALQQLADAQRVYAELNRIPLDQVKVWAPGIDRLNAAHERHRHHVRVLTHRRRRGHR